MLNRDKVNITEHSLLVAHGHSKKLSDIRKKLQSASPVEVLQLKNVKPELTDELNQARKLIDERISEIMNSFPEGKKKRLFSFRYGSVSAIKLLAIRSIFKTLKLDCNSVKLKLIADLNYHGNDVTKN